MAYDFGSKGLGINNPFKQEGVIRSIAGLVVALLGFYGLFQVTTLTETNLVSAWIYAAIGFILLVLGFRRLGSGLFQLFKFFVGRSVPSSLAENLTKSEAENAEFERRRGALAYNSKQLESMLMGRKNTTFIEPTSWMGRLVHSVIPKLIFMPYPIRILVQEIIQVVLVTLIALCAFALTYFVASTGLAGQAGHIIIPVFSFLLLSYLVGSWAITSSSTKFAKIKFAKEMQAHKIAKVFAFSIVAPALIGWLYHKLVGENNKTILLWEKLTADLTFFSSYPRLAILLTLGLICFAALLFLLNTRIKHSNVSTEVSEYRDNLQETVHPNEIFINIENIVLANRRYNEIPNRTYINYDPKLNEQSQAKGDFAGELLIETQPEYTPTNYGSSFNLVRLLSTIAGQVLFVLAAVVFYSLAAEITTLYGFLSTTLENVQSYSRAANQGNIAPFQQWLGKLSDMVNALLGSVFLWAILTIIGRVFANVSHIFWAELEFKSLLMYMKTEGTFSESKVSTGMSIHDSTRSENTIVKSSITPWVISSRIQTSTFATSNTDNVEMPRYIMTMNKNDTELNTIVDEIKQFLRQRETIAGFSNTADLQHAENILKVNQASRASQPDLSLTQQQEAAGFLNQQQESNEQGEKS